MAAVFVATERGPPTASLEALADAFGLTPAEARVLARLGQGESIDAAAAAIGVARTTVKTHLARILSKTGTHRQADLVALVGRLATPTVGEDR
jgi:DNA-binding CsgD family transcriptional regulator